MSEEKTTLVPTQEYKQLIEIRDAGREVIARVGPHWLPPDLTVALAGLKAELDTYDRQLAELGAVEHGHDDGTGAAVPTSTRRRG